MSTIKTGPLGAGNTTRTLTTDDHKGVAMASHDCIQAQAAERHV